MQVALSGPISRAEGRCIPHYRAHPPYHTPLGMLSTALLAGTDGKIQAVAYSYLFLQLNYWIPKKFPRGHCLGCQLRTTRFHFIPCNSQATLGLPTPPPQGTFLRHPTDASCMQAGSSFIYTSALITYRDKNKQTDLAKPGAFNPESTLAVVLHPSTQRGKRIIQGVCGWARVGFPSQGCLKLGLPNFPLKHVSILTRLSRTQAFYGCSSPTALSLSSYWLLTCWGKKKEKKAFTVTNETSLQLNEIFLFLF